MKINIRMMMCMVMVVFGVAETKGEVWWYDQPGSEAVARELLPFGRTYRYKGRFEGMARNGKRVSGSFALNRDGEVVRFAVNGVSVPITEEAPLVGLPIRDLMPIRRFRMSLEAINYSGERKSSGEYDALDLNSVSSINCIMMPEPFMGTDRSWPSAHFNELDLLRNERERPRQIDMSADNCIPVIISNQDNVGEAYFPYDDATGNSGFMTFLGNESYDSLPLTNHDGGPIASKVYVGDIEGMHGLMIMVSDPYADISVRELGGNGHMQGIELTVMEVTPEYRIVYVNYAYSGEAIGKVIITLTSEHPPPSFYFILQGFPTDPV